MTAKQWTLIEPLLPPPNTEGRREKHPRREIVNAIFYVLRTGCSWQQLSHARVWLDTGWVFSNID